MRKHWDFIDLIGYDCGWGCLDYGCEDGPESINAQEIIDILARNNITAKNTLKLGLKELGNHAELTTKESCLPLVQKSVEILAQKTYDTLKNNGFPIIIGGDHSSAIGTWSGVTHALDVSGEFGLIWLDAHMDAHTPATANQGKWGGWWHGMPVACLTGDGLPDFTQLLNSKTKISPEHMTLIGIRSYETGEKEYLERHGITVYTSDDVVEKGGFDIVYQDALKRATTGTKGFGLSIDLDGFDPSDAPGVGTPEHSGLIASDVLKSIKNIADNPLFKCLEIAEYNPHNGEDGITKDLITQIIVQSFGLKEP